MTSSLVVSEFLDVSGRQYGNDAVDDLFLVSDQLPTGMPMGLPTAAWQDMARRIDQFSRQAQVPVAEASYLYGRHLFTRFTELYAYLLGDTHSAFDLLQSVQEHIHREVQQMHPGANRPLFDCIHRSNRHLTVVFRSNQYMADVAQGLIEGALTYFGEAASLTCTELTADGCRVRFDLIKEPSSQ